MSNASTVQDVLSLRDQGLADREVAARLGLTKGQVAGLIFRARSTRYAESLREGAAARQERSLRRIVRVLGLGRTRSILREIETRR